MDPGTRRLALALVLAVFGVAAGDEGHKPDKTWDDLGLDENPTPPPKKEEGEKQRRETEEKKKSEPVVPDRDPELVREEKPEPPRQPPRIKLPNLEEGRIHRVLGQILQIQGKSPEEIAAKAADMFSEDLGLNKALIENPEPDAKFLGVGRQLAPEVAKSDPAKTTPKYRQKLAGLPGLYLPKELQGGTSLAGQAKGQEESAVRNDKQAEVEDREASRLHGESAAIADRARRLSCSSHGSGLSGEDRCSAGCRSGRVSCGACGGKGKLPCGGCNEGKVPCPKCAGRGEYEEMDEWSCSGCSIYPAIHQAAGNKSVTHMRQRKVSCPRTVWHSDCNATGRKDCRSCDYGTNECGTCRGRGTIPCSTCASLADKRSDYESEARRLRNQAEARTNNGASLRETAKQERGRAGRLREESKKVVEQDVAPVEKGLQEMKEALAKTTAREAKAIDEAKADPWLVFQRGMLEQRRNFDANFRKRMRLSRVIGPGDRGSTGRLKNGATFVVTSRERPDRFQSQGHSAMAGWSADLAPTGKTTWEQLIAGLEAEGLWVLDEREKKTKYWTGPHVHVEAR